LGSAFRVGLFVCLKRGLHVLGGARAAGAVTGAAGGTSDAAMVTCCAHHAADVLPLVGLEAAAALLAEYQMCSMAAGLVANLAGIAVMLRLIVLVVLGVAMLLVGGA
jgi:hypothetical protein